VVAYAEMVCPSCGILPSIPPPIDALMRLPVAEFVAQKPSSSVVSKMRSLAAGVRRDFLGYELKSFPILAGVIDS
jgi:hypothetical protein